MTHDFDFAPIKNALETGNRQQLEALVQELNPASLGELINKLEDQHKLQTYLALDTEDRVDVLNYVEPNTQIHLLDSLSADDAKILIEKMPHDRRVDLLNQLPADRKNELMRHLAKKERDDIIELSKFEEGTTGAIMTTDYAVVQTGITVGEAIEKLRLEAPDRELIYYAYVIDADRKLIGAVSLRQLIVTEPSKQISDILTTDLEKVNANEPDHVASRKLKKLDLIALPVVNDEDKLVGIITFDDAMESIEEDVSDTMYQKAGVMTGTSSREKARDVLFSKKLTQGNVLYPVRLRITFLFVTLIGGFLVGGVIDRFEDVLSAIIVAAVFIPVIMDMGGNVGTQSTTIFARGLALGHIKLERIWKHIAREMGIGALIGLILGILAGLGAYYWQGVPNELPLIGLAVGLSLVIVLPLAAFLGFLIPYLLLKMGWDHAPGADPFITTIKDFVGLTLYFTLVSLFIGV
ncbi:MAG: magnesium transporter [Balneolaceae bacterium]|nr:magnesium transporter [Balneolaceae bacterium]MCH8548983.1 magnesium transporter [Balneolaceae bacterium]